jgi:glycosyltransferase involved in cell wall biosynthesis
MTTVLHIISGLGTGGAETTLVNLACALQGRGLPQHVVSMGGEDSHGDELKRAGIALHPLHLLSAHQLPLRFLALSSLIRRLRPDVIQGWMYHGNLMAAVCHRWVGGRSSRRLLWNLRASNMDSLRYARLIRWGAALSQWPDVVVANSEAGAAFHSSQGYRPRLAKVIANGIDTRRFKPDAVARSSLRAELNIPGDAVVVAHVARVDAMKDHATCLSAMTAIPNVVAVLAGAHTEELQTPPNVRALGLRRDVERLYAMSDIVISTSAFGEGFSNAIAEGMSCGLVPIPTDVGDARLIVGDTGHVIAPRDSKALTAVIAEVAALLPADRANQGLRARARIMERFSLENAVDTYEALYRSLAAQAGAQSAI